MGSVAGSRGERRGLRLAGDRSAGVGARIARSGYDYQSPPARGERPALGATVADSRLLVRSLLSGRVDRATLARVAVSRDVRQAWLLGDLLRFVHDDGDERALVDAFARLTRRDAW